MFFFFNDTATTEIYTLSLHDALPISSSDLPDWVEARFVAKGVFEYKYNSGITVFDPSELPAQPGEDNRLILTDLDLADFTFDTFDYAGTSTPEYGVALRLLWTKDGQSGEIHIPNMAEGVDLFEFADGSTLGDIRPNWLREHYANRPAYANDERDRIDGTDNDDFIQTTDTGTRLYTYGGNGDDTIIGSDTGQDDLRGGNGEDDFIFEFVSDSFAGAGNRDIIRDFQVGEDDIDLSAIGGLNFSDDIGLNVSGGNTVVAIDVNGDGSADMEIFVTGVTNLGENDFIL